LSSFFQKGSASAATSSKEQGAPVAAGYSEQSERPGTSSSGTPTISDAATGGGGGGGVFSRFRISPKSKEKSKVSACSRKRICSVVLVGVDVTKCCLPHGAAG